MNVYKKRLMLVLFAIFLSALAWLVAEVDYARAVAKRMQCHGRMSQLVAMFDYHIDRFKSFPPVTIMDEHSVPLHSWRMLIHDDGDSDYGYRYNEKDLHGYNYNEKWDSASNAESIKIIEADMFGISPRFHCPFSKEKQGVANYVAIVTEFGEWYTSLCDEQCSQEVLLVICDPLSQIKIAEPKDITLEQAWRIFERESAVKTVLGKNKRRNMGIFWNFDRKSVICREYTREDLLVLSSLSLSSVCPQGENEGTEEASCQ